MTISFIKMHGCGNDYVYIDCFSQPHPADPCSLAARVSDRHTGIGSDGLILMLPPDMPGIHARMRMFNSDGTEGAMCGNALRCFAMWLFQSGKVTDHCRISMRGRVVEARLIESNAAARTAVVSINMSSPVLLPPRTAGGLAAFVQPLLLDDVRIAGQPVTLNCVSMGNPHAVTFVEDLAAIDFPINGPAIECHREFPDRTNVEFAQQAASDRIRVRVWERGSGETLACGSGACAVAVAAMSQDIVSRNQPVTIEMRGGHLRVTWSPDNNVHLEGPAVESFRGEIQ